jgi:hypothetical protein
VLAGERHIAVALLLLTTISGAMRVLPLRLLLQLLLLLVRWAGRLLPCGSCAARCARLLPLTRCRVWHRQPARAQHLLLLVAVVVAAAARLLAATGAVITTSSGVGGRRLVHHMLPLLLLP